MDNIDFTKPLWNLGHYKGVNDQLEREVGDFLRANTNVPKVYSNDLRHQYASAVYTQNKGDLATKLLGDVNEFMDGFLPGNTPYDSETDKINNQIGREYGAKYSDMPRGQLLYKLLTDYESNKQKRKDLLKSKGF